VTRRAPPITITITVDERNRVGTVVELLLTVSKDKIRRRCKTARSDTGKAVQKATKRKLTYDPKNIGSWQHGPFTFEACFFA